MRSPERVRLAQAEAPGLAAPARSSHPAARATSEHGAARGGLGEAWEFRELLFFLAWRDVKVRYKQTLLGVLWAVIQPLFTMAIFTVLFGRLANVPSEGVPRPIFYFSALLPWLYIANTVSNASMSLVSNANLLTKIYFPRFMLPAAVTLSGLVDFFVGSLLLIGFIAYYHISIGWIALLWPALVVLMVLLALAISLFLAALNVKYRDVKYAVPFAVQLWMFATPVIYPTSLVPARFQPYLALNPATGLIEAFRHILAPSTPMRWDLLGISAAATLVAILAGFAFFQRTERSFADLI
ncbi:MAG TPA: ABC transporter permease [Steroidobacteraceae bacterium]|nr:ABC transporter permease [Steroidobacteraceae bacterium]